MANEIDNDAYDFGHRLFSLRKNFNFTQKEVAEVIGVNKNTIGGYENNTQVPGIETLKKLARVYHTTPDYLLGFSSEPSFLYSDLKEYQQKIIRCALEKFRKENLKTDS